MMQSNREVQFRAEVEAVNEGRDFEFIGTFSHDFARFSYAMERLGGVVLREMQRDADRLTKGLCHMFGRQK